LAKSIKRTAGFIPRSRLEALTDGVFAFAMTLLVVNIELPDGFDPKTNQEFLSRLADLSDTFVAYVITFFVLVSFWFARAQADDEPETASVAYTWATLLHLLSVTFLPFSMLAVGRYDVNAYLWLEGAFVFGTLFLIAVFFSRSARPLLARLRPLLVRVRLERPLRAFYEGVHHYRDHPRLLLKVFLFTTVVQAVRILSLWATCRAVGIELGPRIYYVMGPLFFLVLLVPFTLNGFAVREAFFVSFLGGVGVDADAAFAAGFLYFFVIVALSLPGAVILLWESVRGAARPEVEHG